MKLLLYCTKAKPRLVYRQWTSTLDQIGIDNSFEGFLCGSEKSVGINELGECEQLNGKIVAECDFEVDKLTNCGTSFMIMKYDDLQESYRYTNKIARGSCLDYTDLRKYLGTKDGYAIHIKNLHIFDKPKELNEYLNNKYWNSHFGNDRVSKAPQNMMRVYKLKDIEWEEYILISIRPEWLCKILNGEKTIEVRKVVLKEMIK